MTKSPDAFRTISEVAEWLGVEAHVLRFWETKFSQVRPVKRAGGRRYYRPSDMALLGGIRRLLHDDGLTIRGVQKILRERGTGHVAELSPPVQLDAAPAPARRRSGGKVRAHDEALSEMPGAGTDEAYDGTHAAFVRADASGETTAASAETGAKGGAKAADGPLAPAGGGSGADEPAVPLDAVDAPSPDAAKRPLDGDDAHDPDTEGREPDEAAPAQEGPHEPDDASETLADNDFTPTLPFELPHQSAPALRNASTPLTGGDPAKSIPARGLPEGASGPAAPVRTDVAATPLAERIRMRAERLTPAELAPVLSRAREVAQRLRGGSGE